MDVAAVAVTVDTMVDAMVDVVVVTSVLLHRKEMKWKRNRTEVEMGIVVLRMAEVLVMVHISSIDY